MIDIVTSPSGCGDSINSRLIDQEPTDSLDERAGLRDPHGGEFMSVLAHRRGLGRPRWRSQSLSSLDQSFSARHNSLNLLRLLLASAVIFSHAVVLGGYGSESILGKTTVGTLAVYGFFGLSGFLIAGSATRNSVGRYLWQRFLRILPGFWICLILTAFVFGTVSWFHGFPKCGLPCYLRQPNGPFGYIAHNSWLRIDQPTIGNTLARNPLRLVWNGSLWTLFYEFLCYLLLACLAFSRLLYHRWTVVVLAVGAWIAEIVVTSVPSLNAQFTLFTNLDAGRMLVLVPVFLTGSVLYLYRDKIPDSGLLALGCLILLLLSVAIPLGNDAPGYSLTSTDLVAPVLGYILLWLGIHLPFQRIGARNDYSYGVYIYAFPVAQLLAMWGVYRWGYVAYTSCTLALTIPLAVASWWLVEKRALALKSHTPKMLTARTTPAGDRGTTTDEGQPSPVVAEGRHEGKLSS